MEQKLLKSFKDLSVWQKAANLATLIYAITEKFPRAELTALLNFFIITLSIFFILDPHNAFAGAMFLETENREIQLNNQFKVELFVDTEDENINVFAGKIAFPDELLELKNINSGNSIVNFWVEQPSLISKSFILYSGMTPGGYRGGKGFIFSMIFLAKQEGSGSIEFREGKLLKNDGRGTSADLGIKNLELRIYDLGIEPLHPKSYILYSQDKEPPESFAPEVAADPTVFDGKWFLVFATQDKDSGIDHYEVKETRQKFLGIFLKWIPVESPYVLRDQELKSYVLVKAIDKAGNTRVEKILQKNPLKWYENYENWIIIIAIMAFVVYLAKRFLWRKYSWLQA